VSVAVSQHTPKIPNQSEQACLLESFTQVKQESDLRETDVLVSISTAIAINIKSIFI
jgi:hypothetical protein